MDHEPLITIKFIVDPFGLRRKNDGAEGRTSPAVFCAEDIFISRVCMTAFECGREIEVGEVCERAEDG
jgi:hypothetical protein